ncbi:MAG: transposase [Desulfobacteraceae bacterium]|nr:MAG: transposase [Desulfobacteraceae bacterium]
MPRHSRIDAPGALQHIIGRGLNREKIFSDRTDYLFFLERLGDLLTDSGARCFAWALLPNHFHLLLQTGKTPISNLMKKLLTGYAINYNRRHNRTGHLFQNRYKSILCQEEPYLLELVRYIHLNPLRAGLIPDFNSLSRHPFCGHAVILGHMNYSWQDRHYILRLFGQSGTDAKRKYREFVRKGIEKGNRPDLIGGGLLRSQGGWGAVKLNRQAGAYQKGDERILGNGDFVNEVLANAREQFEKNYRIRVEGFTFDKLLSHVSQMTRLSPEDILDRQRDRQRTRARSILCFLATDQLRIPQGQLAEMLHLTQSAISHAVRRGKALVENGAVGMPMV